MSELNTKKAAFEGAIRDGEPRVLVPGLMKADNKLLGKSTAEIPREEWWTAQEGRELEDEVEKAKHGLLFLGMK